MGKVWPILISGVPRKLVLGEMTGHGEQKAKSRKDVI